MDREHGRSVVSAGSESIRSISGAGDCGNAIRFDSHCWRPRRRQPPFRTRAGVGAAERGAATHCQRRGGVHLAPGGRCDTVMMHLPASVRVYLCLSPRDMRRSFDGLHALVRDHLQLDPFAGHLYLFANRRRDRLKILYWDRDGFAVWSN